MYAERGLRTACTILLALWRLSGLTSTTFVQAPQQNLLVDMNEPTQQMWRGNNTFRTGQVLAMERQLNDIDRQTMEALMTSRSGKLNSQASTSHVIDSKVRFMTHLYGKWQEK
jgi:hypothetical protein